MLKGVCYTTNDSEHLMQMSLFQSNLLLGCYMKTLKRLIHAKKYQRNKKATTKHSQDSPKR